MYEPDNADSKRVFQRRLRCGEMLQSLANVFEGSRQRVIVFSPPISWCTFEDNCVYKHQEPSEGSAENERMGAVHANRSSLGEQNIEQVAPLKDML